MDDLPAFGCGGLVSGAEKNVGMHCWKHSYKMSLKLELRKEMQKIIRGCIAQFAEYF